MTSLLVHLRRDGQHLVVRQEDSRLRCDEERSYKGLVAEKDERFDSAVKARMELEKIVARRVKAGWQLRSRVESPWVAFLDTFERAGVRANDNAADNCQHASHTYRWSAPSFDEPADTPEDYRDLARCATFLRHNFTLRRNDLNLKPELWLRASPSVWWTFGISHPADEIARGELGPDGVMRITGDREPIELASAEAFRAFLPGFLIDQIDHCVAGLH